tara:strand:+ start:233 stop:433 length:201 start_codon:yes stop_codon:yes gene_type:complete
MKTKVEDRTDGFESYVHRTAATSNRTNLNDLLKRVKEQKKNDKKVNFMIFFGMTLVLVFILLMFSL